MKRIALACLVVLACGLACGSEEDPEATDTPTDAADPEPILVPVIDDGKPHFCCEYTEADKQLFALLPHARACQNRFGDRGGKWVEGPQCLPCCCEIPLSPTDPSQGVRHELTVPSACAGDGQCVSSSVPECRPKVPGPRKPPGDDDEPAPVDPPDKDRETIKPRQPGGGAPPPEGKRGKGKAG